MGVDLLCRLCRSAPAAMVPAQIRALTEAVLEIE